jgi:NADH-quinone oxidoreductase subunit J
VSFEEILFSVIAVAAVGSALVMVLHRNPVISAISLIANFFCLALLYLMLQAQLLAVLQIVVYTGAIMVLVVFVIMLLNLGDERRLTERYDMKKIIAVVISLGFGLEMLYLFGFSGGESVGIGPSPAAYAIGTVENMGEAMFGRFLLPFEITSLLLLAAIVGAVALARRGR